MMQRSLLLLTCLCLVSACDIFPTKASKEDEANQKWFDDFYGDKKASNNDYCSFYGTCKKAKTEESSWDWWTGGNH